MNNLSHAYNMSSRLQLRSLLIGHDSKITGALITITEDVFNSLVLSEISSTYLNWRYRIQV